MKIPIDINFSFEGIPMSPIVYEADESCFTNGLLNDPTIKIKTDDIRFDFVVSISFNGNF